LSLEHHAMTERPAERLRREASWDELASLVGAGALHPATARDAVDGVAPARVAAPANAEDLARALRAANEAGLAVIPRGGGTKLDWGRPPTRADLVLSTARLDKVLEHAWADMTATVEAGATVARVQETLAAHGQRLALQCLWPERATIGGILATNDSGPLRARFGSLRDLIIGVTLALPDGTLAKSGGKVVKNVAGYDLPKLATGSFGTLGVITQAVFRLHPLPHAERTLTFTDGSIEALCEVALAIQASQVAFVALQLRAARSDPPALDVVFEGTEAGLAAQEQRVRGLAHTLAPADPPAAVWRASETLFRGDEPAVTAKVSVLPNAVVELCAVVREVAAAPAETWALVVQALGTGYVRLGGASEGVLVTALERLRTALAARGGTLVVLRAAREIKDRFDVWGSPGDALALMRRVKEQLDPRGTLNPGRFVGGI
jgi:glycolate dehydrogenase FAD-binding subunit